MNIRLLEYIIPKKLLSNLASRLTAGADPAYKEKEDCHAQVRCTYLPVD